MLLAWPYFVRLGRHRSFPGNDHRELPDPVSGHVAVLLP